MYDRLPELVDGAHAPRTEEDVQPSLHVFPRSWMKPGGAAAAACVEVSR